MPIRGLAILVVCVGLTCDRLASQQLSAPDREQLVSLVWSHAREDRAATLDTRADWDSALAGGLRLAALPQSDLLCYRRLRRIAALLDDGQADVAPPAPIRSRMARPPLRLVAVERRPFILDYATNDEMRVARPERLAEILAVQGIPAEDWIRDSIIPEVGGATPASRWERAIGAMLDGERGTALHLLLRLPGGEQRGISVTRSVSWNDRWPLADPAIGFDSLPDGLVVVRITAFNDADVVQQFDRAFATFSGVHALIFDLRDARGARREHAYQILARLTSDPFAGVVRRTREYRPGLRALGHPDSAATWYTLPPDTIAPRTDRPAFRGPVVVLISARTLGAAEDFAASFRSMSRGVIIGETSAGSPGEPLSVSLLKNWSLELSAVRDAFSDGTSFTGTGVTPDVPVPGTVDDFLAGKDAALERARAYVTPPHE